MSQNSRKAALSERLPAIALFPTHLRLMNLEWSNWLLLRILFPGINLLFAFTLIVLPENYAQTRKLDRDAMQLLISGGFILVLTSLLYRWGCYSIWGNSQPATTPVSRQQPILDHQIKLCQQPPVITRRSIHVAT